MLTHNAYRILEVLTYMAQTGNEDIQQMKINYHLLTFNGIIITKSPTIKTLGLPLTRN